MKVLNTNNIKPCFTKRIETPQENKTSSVQTIEKSNEFSISDDTKERFKTRIESIIENSRINQQDGSTIAWESKYKRGEAESLYETTIENIQNLIDNNMLASNGPYSDFQLLEEGCFKEKYSDGTIVSANYFLDDENKAHISTIDVFKNKKIDKLIFDLKGNISQYHIGFDGNIERRYDSDEVYRFQNGRLASYAVYEKLLNPAWSVSLQKYHFIDNVLSEYSYNMNRQINKDARPFSETYKYLFDELRSYSNSDKESIHINLDDTVEYHFMPENRHKVISVKFDKKDILF